jgi:hypothetical protein
MNGRKSLPARPSLESLRKQAKKLARDIAAGDTDAIARARAQLPNVALPLTQRTAQLVLAREHGYAGWKDLTAEVSRRLGHSLEWAATQARRAIHDNDVERLKQLLADYPALISWQANDEGSLLGIATKAYGDAGDPERERWFTRPACAELLIDAGAVVTPSVVSGILNGRARGLLQLFQRKGVLPRTLDVLASLGDVDAVRTALDEDGHNLEAINEAFVRASSFGHEAIASLLLEQSIARDPALGAQIDERVGRPAFIQSFIDMPPAHDRTGKTTAVGLWKVFVMEHVRRTVSDGELAAFVHMMQRESWLLDEACEWLQAELIGTATLNGRGEFIVALFGFNPAILRCQPPPQAQAIEFALTYANTHLIPLLTRVWPVPDDLAHAAGMGDLARVRRWFDESAAPALGDLADHYPYNDPRARGHLQWDPPTAQQVLDTALAFSVINHHFDVADFLLAHGADINTTWNSHEPASILHHLVFYGDYDSMQFLIDRGIDMSIKDYRWNATAQGWARYAAKDEKMAQWLEDAERRRRETPSM